MDFKHLDLQPLSDEQIEEIGLSEADLWMVRHTDGTVLGPFDTKSLIKESEFLQDEFETLEVFNLIIEEWRPFFKTTQFQRRMPKLVPAQNLAKSQKFHVLIMGQSFGPYDLDELKDMTEKKKLRLNSEVSTDGGRTWMKMYEYHEFDRRLLKNQDDLPFSPSEQVLNKLPEKLSLVHSNDEDIVHEKDESTLIAGLAFVGRGNDQGNAITYHKQIESPEKTTTFTIKPKFFQTKRFFQACASFAIVAFLSVGYFSTHESSTSQFNKNASQEKSNSPKRINNNARNMKKRFPASTTPSRKKAKPMKVRKAKVVKSVQRKRSKRIIHMHEEPETLDLDDPNVREQIAREIANDEYLDEQEDDFAGGEEGFSEYEEDFAEDIQVEPMMDQQDQLPEENHY